MGITEYTGMSYKGGIISAAVLKSYRLGVLGGNCCSIGIVCKTGTAVEGFSQNVNTAGGGIVEEVAAPCCS